MKTIISLGITLVCLFLNHLSLAQTTAFNDSFNVAQNNLLKWSGDTSKFVIQDGQLFSKSFIVNDLYSISHAIGPSAEMLWSIDVYLPFSTSSVNYVDLVLWSKEQALNDAGKQFFVCIGGSRDKVALIESDSSGNQQEILSGPDGQTHQFGATVQVIYDSLGYWNLSYVYNKTIYRIRSEQATTNSLKMGFAGIRIRQSVSSFHGKHHFDNYYAGVRPVDSVPPQIQSIEIIDQHHVNVVFNEWLQDAENTKCYIEGLLCDHRVEKDVIEVFSSKALTTGRHKLAIKNVSDTSRNVADVFRDFDFLHIEPATLNDVIISEIMADPEPVVGLDKEEYIELFNRSDKIINLDGWTIADGSRTGQISAFVLWPDSFVALSNGQLQHVSNAITVPGFPSLNNNADKLILQNDRSQTIDEVTYDLEWHSEIWKQEGGWSLEKVDLDMTCPTTYNWQSAQHKSGGSPGRANANSVRLPDLNAPYVADWLITSDTSVEFYFSEVLHSELNHEPEILCDELGVQLINQGQYSVIGVVVTEAMRENTTYEFQMRGAQDCYLNQIQDTVIQIAIPLEPEPGEILINEVLFNPKPYGVDFVEVINSSSNILALNNCRFGVVDKDSQLVNLLHLTSKPQVIFPDEVYCFSENCEVLGSHYRHYDSSHCVTVKELPSLPDKEGAVLLYRYDGELLDRLDYVEGLHHPFLDSKEGVSLERRSVQRPTQQLENWASAAKNVGYATPGLRNSQVLTEDSSFQWSITHDPVTPNNDGYDDVFEARFDDTSGDKILRLTIYDRFGRLIATPVNNTLVGSRNTFLWSCKSENGDLVPPDIYIMLLEVIGPGGKIRRYKKGFTLFY